MDKIRVIYVHNSDGVVDASELEQLIKSGKVIAFERQGKWIMTEEDVTRQHPTAHFEPERRNVIRYS